MITVLRVDDRLLHGQVAVSWISFLKADVILIANDDVIRDTTMQTAFRLACPPGVTLSMKSLDGAVNVINNPKHTSRRILILTKTMNDAEYVISKTENAVKTVLMGGLRSGEGKKQIDMNSYMNSDDIRIMNQLESLGLELYMQAVPSSKKLSSEEIRNIYNR